MPRPPRDAWTPEEDAYLRECVEVVGCPIPKLQREWPARFPRRSVAALRMRKVALALVTNPNPDLSQKGVPQPKPEVPTQTVDVKDDGTILHVTAIGSEVKTLDELVARAKIDLTRYEVDKPETSMHETTIRDPEGKVRKVQNFRIVARFRLKAGPSTKEQVEALIAGAFAKSKPIGLKPAAKNKPIGLNTDLMQAVVIADPHLAKYAWDGETGWGDYDLSTGCRLVSAAGYELIEWGDTHRPAVRHLWFLGDVLQYDNPQGTTTGGTPQDRDTRLAKMLEEASSVICRLVERSADTCHTKVIMVGGNHDRGLTVAMQLIVAAYFRQHGRVEVDTTATSRKYVEWGHCLVGLTHGDTARKRLKDLMTTERREAWGRSKVREWHHGHLHREAQTVTEGGITIREHLALCPPDGWHSAEGYVGAPRGMDSVLYSKDGYLRGTWRSPVLDG